MDTLTQLRRQFRKRAADPMQCLINRKGIWHYSRRVPKAVLDLDPSRAEQVRRSTKTDSRREAQFIAREWAERDEAEWIAVVEGKDTALLVTLSTFEKDMEIERAVEVIERRADMLNVRAEYEERAELPDALLTDSEAGQALRRIEALHGKSETWAEAWESFEQHAKDLSVNTKRNYASAVRQFDSAKLAGPFDVTRTQVKQFLRDSAQSAKPRTIRVYIAAATKILAHLFDDDETRAKLFKGHSLQFANKAGRRVAFSRDDLTAMLRTGALSREAALLMRISLGTGARRREVYEGQYDLARNALVVPAEIAKSDSSAREIPLAKRLVPVVEEWVALRGSKRFPQLATLGAQVSRARDLAQLPPSKVLHSCRHSFTTELERAGVSRIRQEALTGHKSKEVHSGYIHLGVEDLRADVEKVDFETGIDWP